MSMDNVHKVGILFHIIDQLSKPVVKIKNTVKAVKKPVDQINQSINKVTDSSSKTQSNFERAKASLSGFTSALGKAGHQIKKVAANSEKLKKSFTNLRDRSAGLMAKGGLITAPFAGLSFKAMNFGEGLSSVSTMLDMSVEDVRKKYNQAILKLAVDIGQSPDVVTEAMYQGLSAGIGADEIISGLETAGIASVGGKTGILDAIDGLTSVVNTYQDKTLDMKKTSDLMFMAVKLGKTTFTELSGSLYNVLPSSSGAGISFEQVTAAIAALTAQGVPTSVATTQIRSAIDELSKSGTKTSQMFKKLSGQTLREFVAEGGNLQEALQLLEQEAESNSLGINDLFSSVEAGGAALMLTGKGTKKFSTALAEMKNAAGATGKAFQKMTSEENVKFRFNQFKALMESLSITLGQLLLPALNSILTGVNHFLSVLQNFAAAHPGLAKMVLLPVAALGLLLTVLGAVGTVTGIAGSGLMNLISTGKMMIKVVRGLNLAFLSSPVFWVLAGIVLLAAAGYLLIRHWSKVKAFFGRAWDFIRDLLEKTPAWLLVVLSFFMPLLGIPALIIKYWSVLKSFFKGVLTFFTRIFGGLINGFNWVKDNWQKLADLFLWLNPFSLPIKALQKLTGILESLNLFACGSRILDTLAAGIKSSVLKPVAAVRAVVGKMRGFLPFSPAREGPLSDLDQSGAGLVKTLARGIHAGPLLSRLGPVLQSVRDMFHLNHQIDSPTMKPGLTLPGSPLAMGSAKGDVFQITVQYNPVVNGENKEDLEPVLQKHAAALEDLILSTLQKARQQEKRRAY